MMRWTAPTTGIMVCQSVVSIDEPQCLSLARIARHGEAHATVKLPPEADLTADFVGFAPNSGPRSGVLGRGNFDPKQPNSSRAGTDIARGAARSA